MALQKNKKKTLQSLLHYMSTETVQNWEKALFCLHACNSRSIKTILISFYILVIDQLLF